MNETETFAGRLRVALAEAGMSQNDLALRMGVSRAAVSRWVNGHRTPLAGTLAGIADALGVSVDWLLLGRMEA